MSAASQSSAFMRSRPLEQADIGEGEERQPPEHAQPEYVLHAGSPQKAAVTEKTKVPSAIDPLPSWPLLNDGRRYALSSAEMSVST